MLKSILFLGALVLAQAHISPTSVFVSLNEASETIDLSDTKKISKFKKTLFIAHDCHACHLLLKKLKKKCSTLDVTTFAVGSEKNLKSKIKTLKKLKADKIYLGTTTQAYADIGIDLMPYYISSNGEKFESGVLNGMIADGVCKKKSKSK